MVSHLTMTLFRLVAFSLTPFSLQRAPQTGRCSSPTPHEPLPGEFGPQACSLPSYSMT